MTKSIIIFIVLFLSQFAFSQCDTFIIRKPNYSWEPKGSRGGVFVAEREEDYQNYFHKSSSIDFDKKLLIVFYSTTRDNPTKSELSITCYPDSNLIAYSIYEKRGVKRGIGVYSNNTYIINKLDLSKTYLKISVIKEHGSYYKIAKYDDEYFIINLGESIIEK